MPAALRKRPPEEQMAYQLGRLAGLIAARRRLDDGRVPDLPCPKCGDADVSVHYCDGCRLRTYASKCRHGDTEHLHRSCRRCRFEWITYDVIDAKVVCSERA